MNRQEYMLTLLMEECAEVSQRASKCLRFGMQHIQQGSVQNNTSRLLQEVIDVLTILDMMVDENTLPELVSPDNHRLAQEKRKRLEKYFKLSQELGCLDGQTCEHAWTNPKNEPAYCMKCGLDYSDVKARKRESAPRCTVCGNSMTAVGDVGKSSGRYVCENCK